MSAFQHVLVGLDVQQQAVGAILARACQLAEHEAIEAVHVCKQHHDHPHGIETSEALDAAVRRQVHRYLEQVCASHGISRRRVLDGDTAEVLHAYAEDNADLVVVGSHGYHGARALFGSTSNAVIHGTPCHVLAVHIDDEPSDELPGYKKILVAVDLGDESFQVMEEANRVALQSGAELAVCNVAHASYDPLLADATERLEHLADTYGIAEDNVFEIAGHVAARVHGLASEIGTDLVVVGTHGKHGLQLLTGSTANAVLHGALCDVLAVRVRS